MAVLRLDTIAGRIDNTCAM